MHNTNLIRSPEGLSAAVDEMRFWLRIMFEHSKFIRGGLNPSQNQEQFIQTANYFAENIEKLYNIAINTCPEDIACINSLVDSSIMWTMALRDFKIELFNLQKNCKAVSVLPNELLEHVRREADFFLTMLYRIKGLPVPFEDVHGTTDGNIPNCLVPRLLIPYMGDNIPRIGHNENLFWINTHMEHSGVLLILAFRPNIQNSLYESTAKFEKRLKALYAEAKKVPEQCNALRDFNAKAYVVMKEWHDFLICFHKEVIECRVPSGQINMSALFLDHMAREAHYYLDVLEILNPVL